MLLRPIVQDTIFPTVCYVAGPNELAYLGQLRGVYDAFGVPMPLMQPRATATVLDSAGVRFLTRYKVPLAALEAQDEHALNELLRAQLPPTVDKSMQEAEAEIAARMEAVIRAVPAIDPTLEGAARSTLGKLQHDLKSAQRQDPPGGQAARRDAAPPVPARARRRRSRAVSRRSAASGSSRSSTATARCSWSVWRLSCPSTPAPTGSSRSSPWPPGLPATPRRRPAAGCEA